MKLPDSYVEKMKRLLGDEFEAYEESLSKPMNHCLRVNTLKISVEKFLEICPFSLSPVPWTNNAFYYDAAICTPSKHPFYFAGLYYLQEPSATLPAATIPIEPGDKVLDLCAAPGGKSTELAAKLCGEGVLVSNDISASRIKALQKNIEAYGVRNVVISCEPSERLSEVFDSYFDKILIDAPCSGEGMFRKSNSMITAWEQNGNAKFAEIQSFILREALKMLRPGGTILYSTCTFDPTEDEDQVQYLLSLDDSLEIVPFDHYEGFEPGHPEWSNVLNASDDLKYTAHLFPHRVKGEGHYVALIKSNSEDDNRYAHINEYKLGKFKEIPEIEEFLTHIKSGIDRSRLELVKDKLYLIPEGSPNVKGLRIMRQGVYLGELKKKRFEPSQSVAMILKPEDFDNVLKIKSDSNFVYKYLRGETLDIDEIVDSTEGTYIGDSKKGWVLVCVDDYPLGFGKLAGGTLKNKYLPGWRMTS